MQDHGSDSDGYGTIREASDEAFCLRCHRRCDDGRVHARCVEIVLGQLADLPNLHKRLAVEIVPSGAAGEKVRSSGPGSRPAASVAVLSLRVGSTRRLSQPDWARYPGWTPEDADVSIPEWVDGWVRAWRQRHGHHRPTLTDAHAAEAPVAAGDFARTVLGLGAALEPAERPDDPLDERITARFGHAPLSWQVGTGCSYLAVWFERACEDPDRHPDLGGFIDGLRDLTSAAKAALGEKDPDNWYCGRCPTMLTHADQDGQDIQAPCGVDLWIDPQTSMIVCRRCHREWHTHQYLALRAAQLDLWPEEELARPQGRRGDQRQRGAS